ncbi:hypothetical protein K7432_017097 [Basidiobolus ranarum]|uniref:Uncharacterized protein n=1 Tax=Basidiobolus ranarum TaxID=34480 RepID=A0ABR2VKS0_9FUNG
MELSQLYYHNHVGRNAALVKPVSPDNSEDMLLDVDLSYFSTDGSISEVEEEDNGFVMDSLFLASIIPLIIRTVKEAALLIKDWRVQSNLINQAYIPPNKHIIHLIWIESTLLDCQNMENCYNISGLYSARDADGVMAASGWYFDGIATC